MTTRTAADPADTHSRTPAQQRAWHDLLRAEDRLTDRPPTDHRLGARLRDLVRARTGGAVLRLPPDRRLWLSKSTLAALSCDGRYLDHRDTPFVWSTATVAGQLAHTAVEIDLAGARRRTIEEIVAFAWHRLATGGTSAGQYLAGLDGVEADALRGDTARRCIAFRDCFPHLPGWMHPRTEVALTWRLSRQVTVKGVPDLVVGRPHPDRRLMQIIDLKTGGRYDTHVEDVRLYALLATVKYGVAPFQVATYYLDEADWKVEEVTADLLEEAAHLLAEKAARAVDLELSPTQDDLSLQAGPGCNWCSRAPDCPLAPQRAKLRLVAA